MGCGWVFQVVIHPLDDGAGLGVFEFQPGDEHAGFACRVHHKGDGAFGGDEGEPGVVKEVVSVGEDDAGEGQTLKVSFANVDR
jgi:hypothetical protein